jgi:nucleotide-binding universal stress UspA family protein
MYETILLPTDGSAGADDATTRGLDLARVADATVHILSVVDTSVQPAGLDDADAETLRQQQEARCRAATDRIVEQANDSGLECVDHIRQGVPYETILAYAAEQDIDLVVMGSHGRTGAERARFGSTTERVITLGDVPVMSVPLGDTADVRAGYGLYDEIVVATDGSDDAEAAAENGIEIAERYGADIHAIYVVDTAIYDLEDAPRSIVGLLKEGGRQATAAVAAEARERNLPAETNVLRGRPDEEIIRFADGVDADLIVLGSRGRGAAPDRLLGSVAARAIEHAEIPVLTR